MGRGDETTATHLAQRKQLLAQLAHLAQHLVALVGDLGEQALGAVGRRREEVGGGDGLLELDARLEERVAERLDERGGVREAKVGREGRGGGEGRQRESKDGRGRPSTTRGEDARAAS